MVVSDERKPENFGVGASNTVDLGYSTVTLLTFCWGGGIVVCTVGRLTASLLNH